ncbi:hypothetical protein ACFL3X_00385 [Gemmatimonadota bacterium]
MIARHRHLIGAAALMVLLPFILPTDTSAQSAFGIRWFGELRSPAPPRTLAIGGISAVAPWGKEPVAAGQSNPALIAYSERVVYGFVWELGKLSGSYGGETGALWQNGPRLIGLVLPLGGGFAMGGTITTALCPIVPVGCSTITSGRGD